MIFCIYILLLYSNLRTFSPILSLYAFQWWLTLLNLLLLLLLLFVYSNSVPCRFNIIYDYSNPYFLFWNHPEIWRGRTVSNLWHHWGFSPACLWITEHRAFSLSFLFWRWSFILIKLWRNACDTNGSCWTAVFNYPPSPTQTLTHRDAQKFSST